MESNSEAVFCLIPTYAGHECRKTRSADCPSCGDPMCAEHTSEGTLNANDKRPICVPCSVSLAAEKGHLVMALRHVSASEGPSFVKDLVGRLSDLRDLVENEIIEIYKSDPTAAKALREAVVRKFSFSDQPFISDPTLLRSMELADHQMAEAAAKRAAAEVQPA